MPRGRSTVQRVRKETKVQLRLRPEQKDLIAQAARLRQTTLSNFVLEHAVNAAELALADQAHFTLPAERWRAFCAALDAPPRSIPALRKLLTEQGVFDGHGRGSA